MLVLARWAEEGRTPALDDARYLATAGRAWLAVPVIDIELLREIAELAIGRGKILQGRAASADRVFQHLGDRRGERVQPDPTDPSCRLARIDPATEQGLADVDVAKPGDHALVEQQQLHRRGPPMKNLLQPGPVDRSAQRLRAERLERRPLLQIVGGNKVDRTE